jgi:subtilase family serine protease
MSEQIGLHPLPLSSHGPAPGASFVAPVHPKDFFSVNVMLRRRTALPDMFTPSIIGAQAPRQRQYLTHQEFEEKFGADPADIELVNDFAHANGLTVAASNIARRTVKLNGTAEQFSKAFATSLFHFAYAGGSYRAHQGPIHMTTELNGVVTAVFGLDERPVAIPMARVRETHWRPDELVRAQAASSATRQRHLGNRLLELNKKYEARLNNDVRLSRLVEAHQRWANLSIDPKASFDDLHDQWWNGVIPKALNTQQTLGQLNADFIAELASIISEAERLAIFSALDELDIKTPPGVAALYGFPEETDGSGQCIGIIELGGGYRIDDLKNYFDFLGIAMPSISDVSIAGGTNRPGINEAYDGEVCLDVEVIGGAAPGARLVCYFAPLTALGFVEAVHSAIHDRVNAPSVISASWDLSEAYWLEAPMYVTAFEEVLKEAAILGVTICCSAGDYGSTSEFQDGRAWVDYPASSPHVLGCGGTTLYSKGTQIIRETVWNSAASFFQATGGGVSQIFPLPKWQDEADVPESVNPGGGKGRGVPDVAANADPSTGYLVQVDGRSTVICGTSAGAPLWAALIARINQSLGVRVGYINPFLYSSINQAEAFHDILVVGNGVYSARSGWDACTGWGTPNGSKLRDALGANT